MCCRFTLLCKPLCVLQISKETVHLDADVVESEATVDAVVIEKRLPKRAAVMKSPFLNDFGSSEGKAAGKRPASEIREVKHVLPFSKQLGLNANQAQIETFCNWYHEGLRPKNKYVTLFFIYIIYLYVLFMLPFSYMYVFCFLLCTV